MLLSSRPAFSSSFNGPVTRTVPYSFLSPQHLARRRHSGRPPTPPGGGGGSGGWPLHFKVIYAGAVLGGYQFGVAQGIFLPVEDIPALFRKYKDRIRGKDYNISGGEAKKDDPARLQAPDSLARVTDCVFLDVRIGETPSRRIEIGLYGDAAPRTCDNFEALCLGPLSQLASNKVYKGNPYSYVNSSFHRVIPNFVVQGGDWTRGDGSGGRSVFNSPKFADEIGGLKLPHAAAGTLSMANAGPNTNSSQFFITLKNTPHLNGRHVVFGKIMNESSMAVIRDIEAVGSARGPTKVPVIVTDCGLVFRTAHKDRDLSNRRSAWFRRRIAEMTRMEIDSPETCSLTHKNDILLLKDLLKQREVKEAQDKNERQRLLVEKLTAGRKEIR